MVLDVLDPRVSTRAIQKGAMKLHRNTGQLLDNTNDTIGWIRDNLSFITGSEKLRELLTRASVGQAEFIAKNRVADNDTQFLKKWGPVDYASWPVEKLEAYITKRLSDNFIGSYDYQELPNWALRGSRSKAAILAPLARWSLGQGNRFIDNVINPAREGNFKPLLYQMTAGILSAEAYNLLNEEIRNKKPRELSFNEWVKLGGKDTAYTLASKADAVGLGGIFSSMGLMALQLTKGEQPFGFSNPLVSMAANAVSRFSQATEAIKNGDINEFEAFGKAALALMTDQLQLYRVLTEQNEDTGAREERLARHVGVLPPKSYIPTSPNPFGNSQYYKEGDASGLGKRFAARLEYGQKPSMPKSEIRMEPGLVNGQLTGGAYYKFIEQAQGKQAAELALKRDQESTAKKMRIYSSAIQQMNEERMQKQYGNQ
jgi:hypothetical protein